MKIVTLEIYDSNGLVYETIVGSARAVYYAAMNEIRFARYTGRECPYMKCSDKRLNFWFTCCRMSVNYGFDI